LNVTEQPEPGVYDAIIVAVSHHQFKKMGLLGVKALGKERHVLYDIKYLFPAEGVDGRL
jgi:UDP-N-acetyl-D-galactosamine dehydrogenase